MKREYLTNISKFMTFGILKRRNLYLIGVIR